MVAFVVFFVQATVAADVGGITGGFGEALVFVCLLMLAVVE